MTTNINEINVSRLIFGIIVLIVALLFLIHTFRKAKKDKNYDAMSYSFDVNVVIGTALILLAAIFLIYRELSKLQFMLIILILLPFLSFSQSIDCDDLKYGVFEVHENNKKVGLIYRKGDFQLEDYLDGKELSKVKIKEKNCLFYIKSLKIKNDLDTITMVVLYNKIKKGCYTFWAKPRYLDINYEYSGKIKKVSNHMDSEILKIFKELESGNKSN